VNIVRTVARKFSNRLKFCWLRVIIIIIMIFYCGLVVHITVTRAQKVVSYTSAHITETVFAHNQHWEDQSCLSSPQLYRHSQKHRKWINHTVGHYTTSVSTCPALRGARHFPSTSYILCLVCTQCTHIFAPQKQYWWDANSETIHGQLLQLAKNLWGQWPTQPLPPLRTATGDVQM